MQHSFFVFTRRQCNSHHALQTINHPSAAEHWLSRYLVQPVGAFWVVTRNQALVTEAHHPLAAVQVWQGEQFFAEHGHEASTRQPQGEPALGADGPRGT